MRFHFEGCYVNKARSSPLVLCMTCDVNVKNLFPFQVCKTLFYRTIWKATSCKCMKVFIILKSFHFHFHYSFFWVAISNWWKHSERSRTTRKLFLGKCEKDTILSNTQAIIFGHFWPKHFLWQRLLCSPDNYRSTRNVDVWKRQGKVSKVSISWSLFHVKTQLIINLINTFRDAQTVQSWTVTSLSFNWGRNFDLSHRFYTFITIMYFINLHKKPF